MTLIHIIQKEDVGQGVYRHDFGTTQRHLLVAISAKFGGIQKCDIGKKIFVAADGQLVWGPSIGK